MRVREQATSDTEDRLVPFGRDRVERAWSAARYQLRQTALGALALVVLGAVFITTIAPAFLPDWMQWLGQRLMPWVFPR